MTTGNGQSLEGRGDGGGLLPTWGQPHFRQQCRDLVEILTFRRPDGTPLIEEHEVMAMVRSAVPMVAQAAKGYLSGDFQRARDYRAIWSVLIALARLQQRDRPQVLEHAHVHANLGDLIQRIEAQLEVAE